jgi:hypothetical protein
MFVIPNKKVTLWPPRCCTGLNCAIALRRSWSAKCLVKISSTFVINFVTWNISHQESCHFRNHQYTRYNQTEFFQQEAKKIYQLHVIYLQVPYPKLQSRSAPLL